MLLVTFTLLPAVDVADGRAVRPAQDAGAIEAISGNPLEAALAWQTGGAEWIHLVDLDAAFGRGSNAKLLADMIGELDVKVELSGGICDDQSLNRALSTGCERVVVSTAGLHDRTWCARAIAKHGERLAFALDVRVADGADGAVQHMLAARGGTDDSGDLWAALEWLDQQGSARYIVTDVSQDGMLSGPNVALYQTVSKATTAPVIASGGISTIQDLIVLAELAAGGGNLEGSIVGTALAAGRFTIPEALAAIRQRRV